MFESVTVELTDESCIGEARRTGQRLGSKLGLDETRNGELGIIITEAARNTLVHGKGGKLLVSTVRSQDSLQADILALDKGAGIQDMERAFQDGFSSRGTPGTGLGAIRRLGTSMDIFSGSGGTALLASVVQQTGKTVSTDLDIPGLDIGGLTAPYPGEFFCGDAICWQQERERTMVLAVDGLGHGVDAAEAAAEAVSAFQKYVREAPNEIISRIHDSLKKTRGAAGLVAEIRPFAGTVTYAGVGNISASLIDGGQMRSLVSHNGTLGYVAPRIQEFKATWARSSMLIMHSDGLQTRWDLSDYPGLVMRKAALIAGVLFRDFARGTDDASVVVVKGST